MMGPELSSDYGDYDDSSREGSRSRGRKRGAAMITRSRSRKRITRKGGSSSSEAVVGMGHRRQRRWSW